MRDSRRNRSRKRLVAGSIRGDQLQRDLSIERLVVGSIHDAHAATTDECFDLVRSNRGTDQLISAHVCLLMA